MEKKEYLPRIRFDGQSEGFELSPRVARRAREGNGEGGAAGFTGILYVDRSSE